ncbi:LuxR C-terminal-related transcriptional regulator [Streptomyces sp. NPDC020681]|uniref:LuxR C-terminal-related transcriptional regulator n=1 Tax=Streptomyces sp. NPDC020681 TaxID=3365083 RepID=UPI003790D775
MRAQQTPDGDPLLTAKFAVPAVPRTFVTRRRLQDRLTAGTAGPLTLITGPAGAGKTTLAASWAVQAATPGPVVWLTVEGDDRVPGAFWAYVVAAFRHQHVPLPDDVGTPARPGTVDHSLLARLAAALTRLNHPVVLVLDGLDRAPSREVASGLDFVVSHARPQLRLVLISRFDPLLPLHRYRAEDRICEIRGADLAFNEHETATLLKRHGVAPQDDSVSALTRRTEGWAAGLRLCALAMQSADDPNSFARSFAASQSVVADYLLSEVLDAQPAATRDLLVRTSILERVHPQLANALTGHEDAEWILAGLTRANAFVERTGDTPWYHCHPLFAEVLRAHLRSSRPGLEPQLRRVAARWFADSGRLTEALEHATEAGEWQYAAALTVDHLAIGRFLTGPDAHRLQRLFSGMPVDVAGAAPALVAAARALAQHDAPGCRTQLDRAGEHLRSTAAGAEPPAEALLAEALLRLLAGPSAVSSPPPEVLAGQAGDLMAQLAGPRLAEHPELEALRRYGLARALLLAGRLGDARTSFTHAVKSCGPDVTQAVRHRCLGELALVESVTGALGEAERHALQALSVAEKGGMPPAERTGLCHLALATVASEQGDLWGAQRHLGLCADSADTEHDPLCATEHAIIRSGLDLAYGNWREALEAIEAAEKSEGETRLSGRGEGPSGPQPPPPWPAERRAVARSAVHLACGDPREAISALGDVGSGSPAATVALAAAHLAAGETDRALRLLAPLSNRPDAGTADQVRSLLLQAHAATLAKDFATADGLLAQALSAARPEQLRRPFAEADPWLRHLLERRAELADTYAWLAETSSGPVLVQRLTDREREVLRFAAQMMSTEEIAVELHLSANTVKTHLKGVYRKLSVSRRGEAVRRAKEFNLL